MQSGSKFLLYIDILGFANMVRNSDNRIESIYRIIDSLNVHNHGAFETIVFSDTILVHNNFIAKKKYDQNYTIMFLCEFAQDLAYRLSKTDITFRAVIVPGEFRTKDMKNIKSFYGNALIDAYLSEKKIPSVGLFLHNSCIDYCDVFKAIKFSKDYSFVFLTKNIATVKDFEIKFPTHSHFAESASYDILYELLILKNTYLMCSHIDPEVRTKYLNAWKMYSDYLGSNLDYLVRFNFHPKAISAEFDWDKTIDNFNREEEIPGVKLLPNKIRKISKKIKSSKEQNQPKKRSKNESKKD